MNPIVKARIRKFDNTGAVKLFFRLLKILIEELNFSPDNEKISLTIPKGERKIIPVNLNKRYILALEQAGNETVLRFMINEQDFKLIGSKFEIANYGIFETEMTQAYLIDIAFENLNEPCLEILLPAWIMACREYEPRQKRSQYRKLHVGELYAIATEENLLEQYLSNF